MKAILMTLQNDVIYRLLNNDINFISRKKFPKKYKGWVYVYCKADSGLVSIDEDGLATFLFDRVIGRFWCENVENNVITINNFEQFNNPMELQELESYFLLLPLIRAPKNFCYIEVEE